VRQCRHDRKHQFVRVFSCFGTCTTSQIGHRSGGVEEEASPRFGPIQSRVSTSRDYHVLQDWSLGIDSPRQPSSTGTAVPLRTLSLLPSSWLGTGYRCSWRPGTNSSGITFAEPPTRAHSTSISVSYLSISPRTPQKLDARRVGCKYS
jgi:hypothetical protein